MRSYYNSTGHVAAASFRGSCDVQFELGSRLYLVILTESNGIGIIAEIQDCDILRKGT